MLGPAGRQVRCSRCKSVWLATVANVVTADLTQEPVPRTTAGDENAVPVWDMAAQPGQSDLGDGLPEGSTVSFSNLEEPALHAFDAPPIAPSGYEPVLVEATPETFPPDIVAAPKKDIAAILAAPREDIESIAARRERDRVTPVRRVAFRWPEVSMPLVVVVLAAALGLLVGFRHMIVSAYPQTASLFSAVGLPVNLRGLAFEQIRTVKDVQDGVALLNVEGFLVNVTKRSVDIPRLRFALRNSAGREVYTWTALASREALGPGEKLPFRSRLASPPAEGQDVVVRFFNKRDAISGSSATLNPPNGAEPKRAR